VNAVMMRVGFLTVVAAAVVATSAAAKAPAPPAAFVSNVTYSFRESGETTTESGYMWYDASTNSQRSDYPDSGVPFTLLQLYAKNQVDWVWHATPNADGADECAVEPVSGAVSVDMWDWISNSIYAGEETVNEIPCFVWMFNDTFVPQTVWVSQADNVTPVRYLVGQLHGDSTQYDFVDFSAETPAASVFLVPSVCEQPTQRTQPKRQPAKPLLPAQLRETKKSLSQAPPEWECIACEASVQGVIFAQCGFGYTVCVAFETACEQVCTDKCFTSGCAEQACTSTNFCP